MDPIAYRENIRKRNRVFCYVLTPLVLLFLYFLVFPSSILRFNQHMILYVEGHWLLSDYFLTLRSLLDGDPYGHCEIYMPLTYLILYPFSQMEDYGSLTLDQDRVFLDDCWACPWGMVSYMLLLLIMSLFFWHSLQKLNRHHYLSNWSMILLFFSSIFIFSIERGNLIILSAAFVNYFFAYYQDSDKKKVWFALFCLCMATILKIYPAIFGLLLLKEKRYKDILYCFAIGIPLVFLPYLAFKGGFENIPVHLNNISQMQGDFSNKWIDAFGMPKIASMLFHSVLITGPTFNVLSTFLQILSMTFVLMSLFLVLFGKNSYWEDVMLLVCTLILYPTNSGFYCGLYFFPVLCIFMGNKSANSRVHYLIILLSCVILNPFQISVLDGFKVASIGSNLALIAVWMMVIASSWRHYLVKAQHGS